MKFEYFEHTADVKFRSYGKDLQEAFANAAYALTNIITDYEKIEKKIEQSFSIEAEDEKALLYDFLEQFLILFDSENFVLKEITEIKIENLKLSVKFTGDNELKKYDIHTHVKAITYHEMEIIEEQGKVTIQAVPDI